MLSHTFGGLGPRAAATKLPTCSDAASCDGRESGTYAPSASSTSHISPQPGNTDLLDSGDQLRTIPSKSSVVSTPPHPMSSSRSASPAKGTLASVPRARPRPTTYLGQPRVLDRLVDGRVGRNAVVAVGPGIVGRQPVQRFLQSRGVRFWISLRVGTLGDALRRLVAEAGGEAGSLRRSPRRTSRGARSGSRCFACLLTWWIECW